MSTGMFSMHNTEADASLQDFLPTPATSKRTRRPRSKSHNRFITSIDFSTSGPAANTRSRTNSQASGQESLPGSYHDTDNELETPTAPSKGKNPAPSRVLNFATHTIYSSTYHPTPAQFTSSAEFAKTIANPQQCKAWYDLLVDIMDFDERTLNQYHEATRERDELAAKLSQLRKKYAEKKNVIDAQSQAYVKVTNDLKITQEGLASAEIQRDQAIQDLENHHQHHHHETENPPSEHPSYHEAGTATPYHLREHTTAPRNIKEVAIPSSWRPRGTEPSKPLSGKNKDEYAAWAYTVKRKVETDAPIYVDDSAKIDYALSKMADPIFDAMLTWVQDQSDPVWADFFEEIEHYLGLHMQVTEAKHLLRSIKMKGEESIDEYYYRIYKLWQRAKTPEEERIRQFIITIRPNLSASLVSKTFTKMRDLLDNARTIEDRKKEITYTHFDSTQLGGRGGSRYTNTSNRGTNSSYQGRSTNNNSGQTRITNSTNLTATPSSAPSNTPKPDAGTYNPNWKFMPCLTKPEGWIGKWYKPEQHPRKAGLEERAELTKAGRCWACRASGHKTGDMIDGKAVCFRWETRMNAQVIEDASSESESEKGNA